MTKTLAIALAAVLSSAVFAQDSSKPTAVADGAVQFLGKSEPEKLNVTLGTLPVQRAWQPGDPIREIPRIGWTEGKPPAVPVPINPVNPIDPLMAKGQALSGSRSQRAFTTPEFSVPGIANTGVSPPDTSADVGKTHIIQSINGGAGAQYLVLNKADGTVAAGPVAMAGLGTGGACATSLGDPVIVYDEMAERWLITEFSNQAGRTLCMYVSSSANAVTSTWTRYAFQTPAFPDYPHYGVWGNSYLITANEGSVSGARPLFMVDRQAMLAGLPAGIVRANLPNLAGFGFQTWTPADHDGKLDPVPATMPGIFMRHRDDESHNAGSNNPTSDFLEMVQMSVDWSVTPPVGTTTPVQQIPIAEFSSNLNGLTAFNAFPQPNAQRLDPLREPIMRRVAYRRRAGIESLVGNLVTDVDAQDTGGIRWFELRRTGGVTGTWTLYQEGTHALADAGGPADRWMAGSAVDQDGNIALSYSVTRQSPGIFPSLRYAGRLAGDPLGALTTSEGTIFDGLGSQSNERWGDYAQLGVDPEDQCTFVSTGQYVNAAGSWQTRVAKFKFDECGGPTYIAQGTNTTQQICAATTPVSATPIVLSYQSFNGFASSVNLGFANPLPTGIVGSFVSPTVTPPGTSTLNLTLNAGVTAGLKDLTVSSVSGAITRLTPVALDVYTQPATAPALTAPANGASNQVLSPVLTWAAAPQTSTYRVEVARDAGFTQVVYNQTVTGTSTQINGLISNTAYFWRVSASNICPGVAVSSSIFKNGFEDPVLGSTATSPVFNFTTVPGPGDCPAGSTANVVFSENMETGAPGWTSAAVSGANTWALSTAFPNSPANAYRGVAHTAAGDQYLQTPAIAIPTTGASRSLVFSQRVAMEPNAANCYDGGQLQVSTDGGTTFTQVTAGITGLPYTGNLGGAAGPAWCNTRPYTVTAVDLQPYAGQTVRFRFRIVSDINTVLPDGWNIDDVRVQTCSTTR